MKKPMEILLITTSGETRTIDDAWTLAKLQGLVGGYIEKIDLPDRRVALIDEEGRIKGLPLNKVASGIVGQPLVGPVVIGPKSILR